MELDIRDFWTLFLTISRKFTMQQKSCQMEVIFILSWYSLNNSFARNFFVLYIFSTRIKIFSLSFLNFHLDMANSVAVNKLIFRSYFRWDDSATRQAKLKKERGTKKKSRTFSKLHNFLFISFSHHRVRPVWGSLFSPCDV